MVSAWDSLHSATLELVRSTPIKQRLICCLPSPPLLVDGRSTAERKCATSFAQVDASLARRAAPSRRGCRGRLGAQDVEPGSRRLRGAHRRDLRHDVREPTAGAARQPRAVVQLTKRGLRTAEFDVTGLIASELTEFSRA